LLYLWALIMNYLCFLALETLETKRKHRVNVNHLARMNTDIKFMEQQIVDLKEEINGTMMKKFGRIVDLDELEETILRRMVYEMRANVNDVKKEYAHKISAVNREFAKQQDKLKNVLQRSTEKLNILTVLEEEKNILQTVVSNQQKMMEKPDVKRIDFSGDLKKLKEISSQQLEQIAVSIVFCIFYDHL
jgi:cilia- and flagella-associated protein 44